MKKVVKTSISRNMTARIKGIVPLWSLFAGSCGAIAGTFLAIVLGVGTHILQGIIAIVGFIIAFSLHRYAIGGRYPYANYDDRSQIKDSKRPNKELDINKKTEIKKSKVEKDKFFLSSSGKAVIAFELHQEKIINFQTLVETLLTQTNQGVRLKFVKQKLKAPGAIEKELTFLDSKFVIFVEVSNLSVRRDDTVQSFWNILEPYGNPLDIEELRDFCKDIVAPGRGINNWELPDGIFPSPLGLIKKEALLHYGDMEKRAGIFSLAAIAPEISTNYQKILDTLGSLEGTTCVIFEGLGQVSLAGEVLRNKTEEIEAYEKHESEKEKKVASKNRINMKMATIVLCHGTVQEISQVERDLSANYRAIPLSELPMWRREFPLFEKALTSIFPGAAVEIPERRQHRIIDIEEAFYYLPTPSNRGDSSPVVELATVAGERFGFRLRKKFPLFIWSGVGDGKSVVLGYILKNYIQRAREGQKIATFTLETGGSCAFVHDDGLVDLSFMLEENDGEFKPFPVPPLKFFFAFGTKGITQAYAWLRIVMKVHDEHFSGLILEALGELRDTKQYRLHSLHKLLSQKCASVYKDAKPDHFSRQYLSSLNNICAAKTSLYGKIFDVEDDGNDIKAARHYYFSQIPAPKAKNDLTDIFYSFAHNAFLCFETSLTGDNFCELLLCIDELHNIFKVKALSHSQVRDFNSQGRKEGKDIIMASQELKDLIDDKSGENLIDSFKEFLFASSANANLVLQALKRMTTGQSKNAETLSTIEDLDELITDIRTYREQKNMYLWSLIDHRNKVNLINFTLPLDKIWHQASESAAREIRAMLMKKYQLPKATIVAALTHCKMPVPEERADIDQDKLKEVEGYLQERKKHV